MLATMGSSIALVVLLSKDMTDNRNDVLYLCRNLNTSGITAGVCFSSRMVITILAFGCAQIVAEIFYFAKAADMQGADYHWLAILAPGKLAVVNLAFGFWLWYYCEPTSVKCVSTNEGELEMIISSVTIFISLMHILFECK